MIDQVRRRLGVRRAAQPVPDDLRSNFNHLFFDIAWFGVVNGTILSFLSIFLTRTGATSQQIGILGAAPAIANLIFSKPAIAGLQGPTSSFLFPPACGSGVDPAVRRSFGHLFCSASFTSFLSPCLPSSSQRLRSGPLSFSLS